MFDTKTPNGKIGSFIVELAVIVAAALCLPAMAASVVGSLARLVLDNLALVLVVGALVVLARRNKSGLAARTLGFVTKTVKFFAHLGGKTKVEDITSKVKAKAPKPKAEPEPETDLDWDVTVTAGPNPLAATLPPGRHPGGHTPHRPRHHR